MGLSSLFAKFKPQPKDSVQQLKEDIHTILDRKVSQIMVSTPYTIEPSATVLQAAEIMVEHNFGSLPVLNGRALVGILSERDFVYKLVSNLKGHDLFSVTVAKLMTKEVVSVRPDATLLEANRILVENSIRKLPVVHEGQVVGVITQTDLVKIFHTLGSDLLVELESVPTAADIAKSPVVSIDDDAPISAGKEFMKQHRFGSLLVTSKGKPVGMFTERDFMRALVQRADELPRLLVKDVRSRNLITVPDIFSVFESNELMIRNGFRRLPVENLHGRVTGIITQTDLNREMYQYVYGLLQDIEQGRITKVSRHNIEDGHKRTLISLTRNDKV